MNYKDKIFHFSSTWLVKVKQLSKLNSYHVFYTNPCVSVPFETQQKPLLKLFYML